ncbi:transposase [Bifidobacterium minimum]|uniref:Transposase n=1 Tax=Bifidobacterium minimum TaxID=1693 RepID=A0A087BNY4_9BIFI|nr:transposase [Bifidobacterium minimum]
MPKHILQVDQPLFETELDRMVTQKVTQILNRMLDAEADDLTGRDVMNDRIRGRRIVRAITGVT